MTTSLGLTELLDRQSGVVSRSQPTIHGVTASKLKADLRAQRWRAVRPTVYAAHTGQLTRASQLWAAVLVCRVGAVLSHETAAEVHADEIATSSPSALSCLVLCPLTGRDDDQLALRAAVPRARSADRTR